jgi:hypothetical protein
VRLTRAANLQCTSACSIPPESYDYGEVARVCSSLCLVTLAKTCQFGTHIVAFRCLNCSPIRACKRGGALWLHMSPRLATRLLPVFFTSSPNDGRALAVRTCMAMQLARGHSFCFALIEVVTYVFRLRDSAGMRAPLMKKQRSTPSRKHTARAQSSATAAVSSCSKQALRFRAGAGQRPVGQHDLPTARRRQEGRLKTGSQAVGRTYTRGSEARARWLMQVSTAHAESSPPTLLPSSQAQGLSAHCWTRRPRGPQRLSPHAAA